MERVRAEWIDEFAAREAHRRIYERVRLEERALAWKWFRSGAPEEKLGPAREKIVAELDELGRTLHNQYFERR